MQDEIFIKLVEAVEAEGGELLAETHFASELEYITEEGKDVPVAGSGCGQDTLLMISYDDQQPDKEGNPTGDTVIRRHIKVCAIDDRMDLWPRYAKVVYGDGA